MRLSESSLQAKSEENKIHQKYQALYVILFGMILKVMLKKKGEGDTFISFKILKEPLLKVSYFQNVFLMTPNLPKNGLIFSRTSALAFKRVMVIVLSCRLIGFLSSSTGNQRAAQTAYITI